MWPCIQVRIKLPFTIQSFLERFLLKIAEEQEVQNVISSLSERPETAPRKFSRGRMIDASTDCSAKTHDQQHTREKKTLRGGSPNSLLTSMFAPLLCYKQQMMPLSSSPLSSRFGTYPSLYRFGHCLPPQISAVTLVFLPASDSDVNLVSLAYFLEYTPHPVGQ